MSFIQRQIQLGRELFEINTSTLRRVVEQDAENLRRYFEMNSEFAKKVPEIREVSSFVELQREYGATMWEGVKEAAQERGQVLREAVEHTGTAVRGAWSGDEAATKAAA
ncbi:MAG: phasin family protein [Pseudomonadaceae bacterium]|nr:phasin family protein [Pseudomonadaceae bacterium]